MAPPRLKFPSLPSIAPPSIEGQPVIGAHEQRAARAFANGMSEVRFTLHALREASTKIGPLAPARLALELIILLADETVTGKPAIQMAAEITRGCAVLAAQRDDATSHRLAHLSEAWKHLTAVVELQAKINGSPKPSLAAFNELADQKEAAMGLAARHLATAQVEFMAQAMGLDPLP
ncbi:TPA: hypothetical protein VMX41_001796 [Streptococcus pyogenes]|nr:hypothetical protein [Streptococcus pyogenes]